VSVPLPVGFAILWTADGGGTDPIEEWLLEVEQRNWLADLRDRSTRAPGVVLCAVHAELWQGEPVTASLVVSAQPFDEAALGRDGLHAWALDRTSTAGEVTQLQLAGGWAVRTVDVVAAGSPGGPAPGSAGVVEAHLPEVAPGLLVSLILTTPHVGMLGAYAALVSDIAHGVAVDVDAVAEPHA